MKKALIKIALWSIPVIFVALFVTMIILSAPYAAEIYG